MKRFSIIDLSLPGLKLVERQKLGDSRGFLSRLFCSEELAPAGWLKPIAQINHTYTVQRGTVRGLHFQYLPHTEMKFVICLKGEVWDVAVDLRAGSPTFLKWHAEVLSAENNRAFLIPEGCAHGFQAMTDHVELLYLHTAPYAPNAEGGINPQDTRLSIPWPLSITVISQRDLGLPTITPDFEGLHV